MKKNSLTLLTVLSIALAAALTIVSYFGAFVPGTYERDVASMAAQGKGQDLINLFLVTPLLIISLIFMHKESKTAFIVFSGAVFYILYSFFIYCFGVYFNNLFLLYCTILGLSLYAFIIIIIELNKMDIQNWFSDKTPNRTIGVFLLFISAMFYMLWLKDIVPAILDNTTPTSVSDYKLLVNPVHVLDISIVLPGLIITAILLIKRRRLGFILTGVALIFTLILSAALIGMVVIMKSEGISDDVSIAYIFIVLAAISSVFAYLFFRNIKTNHNQ